MKKIKEILIKLNDWKFIILIIFILGSAFYWYELRPIQEKKDCFEMAKEYVVETKDSGNIEARFNNVFDLCLKKKGL